MVEAISILRDRGYNVTLSLVGGGSGLAQQLLDKQLLETDPQREFIQQLDFLPHCDMPSCLLGADLFVFASSCENLPITLLEAMAVGLPIACSDRGPMPEVLMDAGVYFDPEDYLSIATAIEKIIIDPGVRRFISDRARSLSNNFTWGQCARETWRFLVKTYSEFHD